MKTTTIKKAGLLAAIAAGLTGCSARGNSSLSIDGSSTVAPISEAVAEEYRAVLPEVNVTVGVSGTGGGFKKFGTGETAINDASRPIKPSEAELAAKNGIEFIELPVAYDGLTVVVHKDNAFVDHLTVAELKKIWQPGSTVQKWSDVRPDWPELEMKLFGPGTDSGTFDYFTDVINGKEGACRQDFQASEKDEILVAGVAGEKGGLGYFGYAYFVENRDKLKAVPIQGKGEPVAPSEQTINDGSYAPLSRPIFIYVNAAKAKQQHVNAFVEFYLAKTASGQLIKEVGYINLPASVTAAARRRFQQGITGSVYAQEGAASKSLRELYQ